MKTKTYAQIRKEKIEKFDPNGPAIKNANVFGLPFTTEEATIVLLPVPWEATVSYGSGTAKGPEAIFEASAQVDLYHPEFPELWKSGIAMADIPKDLLKQSTAFRKLATKVIDGLSEGVDLSKSSKLSDALNKVNLGSAKMIQKVKADCTKWMAKGKLVGLIGGDHSTPLGFLQALSEKHSSFGILQIDAHMDLRNTYEGFAYSHASIMRNALKLKQVTKLVQVGIRDYCLEEAEFVNKSKGRVEVFTYAGVAASKYEGISWKKQCDKIIDSLPSRVYISFDIDGLDPKLCPNTGTPVAGGFEFHEITYLLSQLIRKKKQIIGFDLNEVAPGEDDWDGNVGARMLFHLCGVLAASNKIK